MQTPPENARRAELCVEANCVAVEWLPEQEECLSASELPLQLTVCPRQVLRADLFASSAAVGRDGDHIRFTVMDAAGTVLFMHDAPADFEEYRPNGPDCDPNPCRRIQLDL